MKKGNRVRVTEANKVPGYRTGDKGTVLWDIYSALHGRLYHVAMDKDDPAGTCPIFTAQEIEVDA